ncbi:MAG: hypothetical protein MUF19_04205 [Candidatus Pacebacteria bacterium]|jgi:hypothetical protein|nr:hypothetical protein [Candidatus Paceibacterota bacterium]
MIQRLVALFWANTEKTQLIKGRGFAQADPRMVAAVLRNYLDTSLGGSKVEVTDDNQLKFSMVKMGRKFASNPDTGELLVSVDEFWACLQQLGNSVDVKGVRPFIPDLAPAARAAFLARLSHVVRVTHRPVELRAPWLQGSLS